MRSRPDADLVKVARTRANLSLEQAATLVGVDAEQLRSIEAGRVPAPPAVLDAYARAFGVSLTAFMQGQLADAVSSLLFRSLNESGPSFKALAESGALATLGEFLRCVRLVADLHKLGDHRASSHTPLDDFARPELPIEPHFLARSEQLAGELREKLGLGTAPIPSMVSVFERLGIELFWVTPEELDVEVDAAFTTTPLAATLVNLVGGSEQWWRTRMTLAHELCHVLFDREFFGESAPFAMLSPNAGRDSNGRTRLPFPAKMELLERRARAFAVHFLVPRGELERLIRDRDPRSDGAVAAICEHFQVGHLTAVNQLRNVAKITDDERKRMLERRPVIGARPHPDAEAARPGLRSGTIRRLALQALAAGKIDRLMARSYLDLDPTIALPREEGLSDAQCAPLHDVEARVRKVVQRHLLGSAVTADCYVDEVGAEGGRWLVRVTQAVEGREAVPRGYLVLGTDLQILEEHISPHAPAA